MKQTAVEYLFEKLWQMSNDKMVWYYIFEKAKEMEKQQAINDYEAGLDNGFAEQDITGEQYYKEVYEEK